MSQSNLNSDLNKALQGMPAGLAREALKPVAERYPLGYTYGCLGTFIVFSLFLTVLGAIVSDMMLFIIGLLFTVFLILCLIYSVRYFKEHGVNRENFTPRPSPVPRSLGKTSSPRHWSGRRIFWGIVGAIFGLPVTFLGNINVSTGLFGYYGHSSLDWGAFIIGCICTLLGTFVFCFTFRGGGMGGKIGGTIFIIFCLIFSVLNFSIGAGAMILMAVMSCMTGLCFILFTKKRV